MTDNEQTQSDTIYYNNQNPPYDYEGGPSSVLDISDLDPAEVLAALYNNANVLGMGILQARAGEMTVEDALECLEQGDDHYRTFDGDIRRQGTRYFDYLYGKPLKLDFNDPNAINIRLYDRDNGGPGAAQRVVEALRASKHTD